MRRPSMVLVGWVAATVAATGVAVAGVNLVSSRVVEPLPPISADVSSSPTTPDPSDTATGVPTGDPTGDPTDAPTGTVSDGPTAGPSRSPAPTSSGSPRPAATTSPTATESEEPSDDDSSPSPSPSSTSSSEDASDDDSEEPSEQSTEVVQRSYQLVGGSVTLRFQPGRVTVVSATPNDGFTVTIEGNGTNEVDVEFRSSAHRSEVKGWWDGGPRDRVREEAED